MVEMELNRIVIDEKRHDQLIVLKEKKGNRILPIVIGLNEASAIKLKISGFSPPRPLTHDLLYTTIENLEAKIDRVVIDKLEDNTFHAKIILKSGNGDTKVIDARPSLFATAFATEISPVLAAMLPVGAVPFASPALLIPLSESVASWLPDML